MFAENSNQINTVPKIYYSTDFNTSNISSYDFNYLDKDGSIV